MKKLVFICFVFALSGCDFQDTFFPRPKLDFTYYEYGAGVVGLSASGENLSKVEWVILPGQPNLEGIMVQQKFAKNGMYLVKCIATHKGRSSETTKGVKVTTAN